MLYFSWNENLSGDNEWSNTSMICIIFNFETNSYLSSMKIYLEDKRRHGSSRSDITIKLEGKKSSSEMCTCLKATSG